MNIEEGNQNNDEKGNYPAELARNNYNQDDEWEASPPEEEDFEIFEASNGGEMEEDGSPKLHSPLRGLDLSSEQDEANLQIASPPPPPPPPSSQSHRPKKLAELKTKSIVLGQRPHLPSGTTLLLKLPAFMTTQSQPYDAAQVLEELAEEDIEGMSPAKRSALFLRAATTLRWRRTAQGEIQSNSQLIQWSDGSLSIAVGGELFEVARNSMSGEHWYVYGRHPNAGCMEAVTKLDSRLTIRPFIIPGSQHHRKYLSPALIETISTATTATSALASSSTSAGSEMKVKIALTMTDPEKEKQRLIKLEQEKIREKRKMEARRRHLQQRYYDRVSRGGLTAKFLEEEDLDDDDDEIIDGMVEGERPLSYQNVNRQMKRPQREINDEEGEEAGLDEYDEDFIDDTNIESEESSDRDSEESSDRDSEESEAQFSDKQESSDEISLEKGAEGTTLEKSNGSDTQPKKRKKARVIIEEDEN